MPSNTNDGQDSHYTKFEKAGNPSANFFMLHSKIVSLISFLFLVAACSSEEPITPSPLPPEKSIIITFSANSININSIDSAYVALNNGVRTLKRYFETSNSSISVNIHDLTGTWEADLTLYTKHTDNDYPRQYIKKLEVKAAEPLAVQAAPTGSMLDTWHPRILIKDSDVSILIGLSPEDPLVRVEVATENKWDYFSISKSALFINGHSVLIGSTFFEITEPIQPPGILNTTDLDLANEILDKPWNEIKIYGLLVDNESEEKPFCYRIAL